MGQSQDRAGTGAEPYRRTSASVWLDGESNPRKEVRGNEHGYQTEKPTG